RGGGPICREKRGPTSPPAGGATQSIRVDLRGDAESVVAIDPEIANGAFQLGMPKQQLNRSQIAGLAIDLGCLRATHRMGAVGRAVESGALDPNVYDPRILPCGQVRLPWTTAGEQILATPKVALRQPVADRGPCLLGDFELNR